MARLTLRLLGAFEARWDGGARLRLPTRKTEALLAYLALPAGRTHPRDELTALLWAERPDRLARQSLRQALWSLRQALGPGTPGAERLGEGDLIGLDPALVAVDAAAFERLAREGTPAALEQASALYRGELLAGLVLDAPAFEEWLVPERERLRDLLVGVLARLVTALDRAGDLDRAIPVATRLVTLEPLQEAAHRALMRLYARAGRRGSALRQYQVCVDLLAREIGAEPEPATRHAYEELLRGGDPPVGPPEPPGSGVAVEPRPGAALPDADPPLVGRDLELARLRRALDEGAAGRGSVVALLGEAGAGKTRMARELVAEARQRGWRVLEGRAFEAERGLALGPWAEALRGGVGLAELETLLAPAPAWRAELERLLPELARGGPPPPVRDEDHLRLFEAVAHVLRRLAASRPLLLVFEDAHWADDMSLRLLAFAGRRVAGWPAVMAVTAREEELAGGAEPALGGLELEARLVRVPLERLGRPAIASLVRRLARSGRSAATLSRLGARVWAQSEGNPFMAVEAVRAHEEAGRAGRLGAAPLPERVRRLVGARLARLSPPARHLVGLAAVVGREFDFRLLARAAGADDRLAAEGLEELVRRRLLRASGERLEFTHEVIRQVAEDGLLPHRRRAVHRAVAEALESLEPPPREQVAARLAHHYAVADVPDRAMACLGQVADRALRAYASGEAVRALEAALGEAERLPAASRERGVLETSLRLAFAQASARQYGAIRDRLVPLRPRFERLGDPVLLGLYHARLAVAHSVLWAHEEADHAARQALAAATRSGDANVLGLAHYVLAVEALRSGRPLDGTTEGRRAVAFLARADEDHMQGLAWWVLGLNHHVLGEFERALEAHAEARHLGERTHDHGLRAAAEVGAAWVHLTRGDLERAAEAARASLAHSPDGFHRASANGVLAAVALEGGAGAPALAALEQAVRQVSRLTMRELILMTLLAEGQLRLGRVAEARETGERLLRLAEETRLAWGTAGAWRVLGNVARATGDAAASAARLTRALELFEAVPAPFEVARTRLDLAALALAGGGDPRARDWLVEAERVFRAAGAPAHAARAARLQARGPTGAPPAPDAR